MSVSSSSILNVLNSPFFLIAGPCVIESEALTQKIAAALVEITQARSISFIFKASFDKANRTSGTSFRGPGLTEGVRILGRIRETYGCPVTTDIHECVQVAEVAEHVDLLQIPAFLCRQTDLLVEAAKSGRAVNVKKGQFLAPTDVNNIGAKLKSAGAPAYVITERGTTFGYNNLVVDMRGLATMRQNGHRVVFDATHSVQRPGGQGTSTGGDGDMVPVLARAAMAVGIDGLFIETHPNPSESPSDGPNMIPLNEVDALLARLLRIREAAHA